MNPSPPLVEVVWLDAITYNASWDYSRRSIDHHAKLAVRKTVGFLVKSSSTVTALAQTWDEKDQEVDTVTCIPTRWVQRITKLGVRRK